MDLRRFVKILKRYEEDTVKEAKGKKVYLGKWINF